MRIIGGTAGGRHLASPDTDRIRPTSDRVREALFSMLGPLDGATAVDAFAGAGTLGLEALSRGADHCYFFDTTREAIATIEENLERTSFHDRATVAQCAFARALTDIIGGTPDLWFLDPPYHSSLARKSLEAMASATDVVTPGALVVWESARDEDIPEVRGFETTRERSYGSTRLTFFRRVETKRPPNR